MTEQEFDSSCREDEADVKPLTITMSTDRILLGLGIPFVLFFGFMGLLVAVLGR